MTKGTRIAVLAAVAISAIVLTVQSALAARVTTPPVITKPSTP